MIYLFIRQTAVNFAQWKEAFDSHRAARQAGGATAEVLIFRNVDDPHEIIILLGWCDTRQARLFCQSVSWQMVLQQMGVVGLPEVLLLEGVG